MAKITDLSNELLINITSYLSTGDEYAVKTLLYLCRTSRVLLGVAQPALYTSVRIVESTTDPLIHLKLFLRTVIECPSLAQKTKELALFNDHGILARLPNLRHLHLTTQIEAPRSLMQRMHEMQADLSILSKLKTFHLHKQYEDGPVDIEDYIPLMQYPSFERFSSESDVPDTPHGSRATNVITHTNAELSWCIRPLSTMEKLLDACPHLTVFKLDIPSETRYRWLWDVGYDPLVTPRDLVQALLRTHRQKLQTLYLNYGSNYNLNDPELQEEIEMSGDSVLDYPSYHIFTYPSFRDFETLSRITIEFERLYQFQDLPASLEHLQIICCHFEDLNRARLSNLIRLKDKWCPVIQSVTVCDYEEINQGINIVRDHATSLGMSVRVSAYGRVLTILGAGYHLTVKNLAYPMLDVSTHEDVMDISNLKMLLLWIQSRVQVVDLIN
ncbi:uncharacterized protein SETTUDRAFT_99548 [Exserohilum turcica Et28A]|uniref:F-box domain-containing protein n=1 Tax=Exserohilum turcicum (strain 28A) TaxID=671987 RepID=R0I8K4_EXST2|nr:uncharacterized protein SETTUDRAFT_99548 [Exserohilum turcica Et28A]EOA81726.1 hypothetical protein SETTUDRAFT_99548 [Exserohilum turcica Et28A]